MRSRRAHLSETGMRLDRFVRIHFADVPHGQLSALWRKGAIRIDGAPARPSDLVRGSALISLALADPTAPRDDATPLSPAERARLSAITLIDRDGFLVLNKPSGIPVHAGTGTKGDLDALLARCIDPATGERPVLIHRLDKDTSGVLIAARTKALAQRLGKALAAHQLEKVYLAVVEGWLEGHGTIDLPLAKRDTPVGGRVIVAKATDPDAKPAKTEWTVHAIAPDNMATLVELRPLTGRTHQLRAHMKAIGHSIRGDRLYGAPAPEGALARLHLHAWRICLPAPWSRTFEAPIPDGFWPALAESRTRDQ